MTKLTFGSPFEKTKTKVEIIKQALVDQKKNKKVFSLGTYLILFAVAFVMTLMNVVTDKGELTWITGIFSILCIVNILLCVYGKKNGVTISNILLALELLVMFSLFLLTGNPEGFSAIWICLLPALGMLFFGLKLGSALSAVMFVELAILLWTPFGNSFLPDVQGYTDSFLMRFPVLYGASFCMAVLLEALRHFTYEEMDRMRRIYRELSVRDQLTGLLNRQGMYASVDLYNKNEKPATHGIMMMDIDHFKAVNDTYGHAAGDEVLKKFAFMLMTSFPLISCRWGGEEFLAFTSDDADLKSHLEAFRKEIENHVFLFEEKEIRVTVSIGGYVTDAPLNDLDVLIERADILCYQAKNEGRNCVVMNQE